MGDGAGRIVLCTHVVKSVHSHPQCFPLLQSLWDLPEDITPLVPTPFKIAKMYPSESPACWRQCGDKGTLAHSFCYCKSLRSYWRQIFSLISEITGNPILPNPAMVLLLHIGAENIPLSPRSTFIHLLLTAKVNIAMALSNPAFYYYHNCWPEPPMWYGENTSSKKPTLTKMSGLMFLIDVQSQMFSN